MTTFQAPLEWKSANWWRNRSFDERLFHAKIPKRLKSITPEGLPPAVEKWLDFYEPGSSLYIHGKTGTGKSVLAKHLLELLLKKNAMSGRFVSSDGYIEMLKDQFDNDNTLPDMYSMPYLVKYIQGVFDVVVVDGAGQERETEFANHEIGSLLRRRYEDMRSVIITTELGTIDFIRRYGDRVKSAINDMHVVRMP